MDVSSAVTRPVSWALYAIAALLCVAPLADLAAGLGSLPPGGVQWRFGVAGLLSGAMVLPLLGLGLTFVAAVLLEHRLVLRILSIFSMVLAISLIAILVLFILDTFQVRVQVRQEAKRAFDLAALKAAALFFAEAIVLAVLTVNVYRVVKHISGTRESRRSEGTPLVVAGQRDQ